MSAELLTALPIGAAHDIAMSVGGEQMVLRMRVTYSRRERRRGHGPVFVTGLAYVRDVTEDVALTSLRLAS